MGSIYKGSWFILEDLSIDYALNIKSSNLSVPIEDVWVDLSQAVKILADDGRNLSSINKIWSVNSNAYCPILDFIHQTAQKTANKSNLFKVKFL